KLIDSNIPIVMIGKPPFEIECDCVMCDDILGAFTAVSHFIDGGHTSILHVFDSGDDAEALVERQEGYRRAIVKRLPDMAYLEVDIAYSGWESKFLGYISEHKVTAVFSDTDTAAAQVHFLKSINPSAFPDNFSIIAYSTSTIFDIFNIKIPSVDIPRELMGRKAIEHLKSKILSAPAADAKSCQQHYIFKPMLESIIK
ncbi:MAG: substrate-binding domain-containing protein, partial [Saccharofermentanales bacterium]